MNILYVKLLQSHALVRIHGIEYPAFLVTFHVVIHLYVYLLCCHSSPEACPPVFVYSILYLELQYKLVLLEMPIKQNGSKFC